MTMSKLHIEAVTAAGHPRPEGILFKGCILGCANAWGQGLAFEQREREAAADKGLEVCDSDTCASLYSSQCCEQQTLTEKGRQAQVMTESSEVSTMNSLFGDDQCSIIIQKFAQSHRLLATVSVDLHRLRQEDSNGDGHRAVSPIVSSTREIQSPSIDTGELRKMHDSVRGPETLGGQICPSGSNMVSTKCPSR
jgi:hypothetical protein